MMIKALSSKSFLLAKRKINALKGTPIVGTFIKPMTHLLQLDQFPILTC